MEGDLVGIVKDLGLPAVVVLWVLMLFTRELRDIRDAIVKLTVTTATRDKVEEKKP